MKRYWISAVAAMLLTGYGVSAQDKRSEDADQPGVEKKEKGQKGQGKLDEYDEIIIKRKDGGTDGKVTIEIKDDEVLVDGKPIKEYENESISVRRKKANRYKLTGPASPFRFEGGDWMMDGDMGMGEERPFLGVMTEGSSNGARVDQITENSAAEKAGLKEGDVITRINGKEVFDHEQLSNVIGSLKPGEEITITYKRDGKEKKATTKLGKRTMPAIAHRFENMPHPNMPPMMFNFDNNGEFDALIDMGNRPRLGIKAQDTEEGDGVRVLEVQEGSAAEKSGIKKDDIITSFDGKTVSSAAELARVSREAKDKSSLKVDLKRNGKQQSLEIKVPKKLKTANL